VLLFGQGERRAVAQIRQAGFGSGYTTLIAVHRLSGGWVARWWASSGC
jgi:hypothetical protein